MWSSAPAPNRLTALLAVVGAVAVLLAGAPPAAARVTPPAGAASATNATATAGTSSCPVVETASACQNSLSSLTNTNADSGLISAPLSAQTPTSGGCTTTDPFGCSYWCERTDLGAVGTADCRQSGSPASPYPTEDYYIDAQTPKGTDQLSLTYFVDMVFQALVTGVWSIMLWAFRGILFVLDGAFSLNLFGGNGMPNIAAKLHQLFTVAGIPLMPVTAGAAGATSVYLGWVRGEFSRSVSNLAAYSAATILLVWVIAYPAQTIGWVSQETGSLGARFWERSPPATRRRGRDWTPPSKSSGAHG